MRNGFSAKLRNNIKENPFQQNDKLWEVWEFGWNNAPDYGFDGEMFVVCWACFKCGSLYKRRVYTEDIAIHIWERLRLGSTFCERCGDS